MSRAFNPHYFHSQLVKKLIALTVLCDDFENLKILSEIADLFYSNVEPEYKPLYKAFEKKANELRDNSKIGGE